MAHALVCRGSNGLTRAALDILCWRETLVLVGAGRTALVSWQSLAPPLSFTPPPPTDGTPHTEALRLRHVDTRRLLQAAGAHISVIEVVDHAGCHDRASQQE